MQDASFISQNSAGSEKQRLELITKAQSKNRYGQNQDVVENMKRKWGFKKLSEAVCHEIRSRLEKNSEEEEMVAADFNS